PATAVQDLLLAGVERVALRADLHDDLPAGFGAAGLEAVAAATQHGGLDVVRVNTRFHDVLFDRGAGSPVQAARAPAVRREPEPIPRWGAVRPPRTRVPPRVLPARRAITGGSHILRKPSAAGVAASADG